MKSARAAGTSRSSGLSLRICLLVKSTIGEQESKCVKVTSQMDVTDGKNMNVKRMSYKKEEALLHWA